MEFDRRQPAAEVSRMALGKPFACRKALAHDSRRSSSIACAIEAEDFP